MCPHNGGASARTKERAGASDTRTKDVLKDRIGKSQAVFFLSLDGDAATGFVTLYRRKNIGRQLVAAVQAFANERGSRSIMVEIPHREPHLAEFYESIGFQIDKDFNLFRYYLT